MSLGIMTPSKASHSHSLRSVAAGAGVLFAAAVLPGCSGGGGDSDGSLGPGNGVPVSGFQLNISLPNNAVWEINRPIDFEFSFPVDFSTVSFNSIRITDLNGVPASGEFELLEPDVVRFQPNCPTLDDFSDAGFAPGGVIYNIFVLGEQDASLAVQSTSGAFLQSAQSRTFSTPNSTLAQSLFLDPVPGPPSPDIRGIGDVALTEPLATRIEVGGAKTYFELPVGGSAITVPSDQPLNLYSDADSQIAFVLEINQPVNPASSNINSNNLFVEAEVAPGVFQRMDTRVELVRNCTESGATIRLQPRGVLPVMRSVRAVISPAFEDLVGERNLLALDEFGVIETGETEVPAGFADPDRTADEFLESFTASGTSIDSFEDTEFASATPQAVWGDGELRAAFDFGGNGGPGGNFDVLVRDGEELLFDTIAFPVSGGPNALSGFDSTVQTAIGGVLNVRNLRIEEGGAIRGIGPNPLIIQATGKVEIFGVLSVDGTNGKNVATLNTGNQPEVGAAGNAGGGRGGTGSFLTTTSTPKGGDGFAAFQVPGNGGGGGHSGYATGGKNNRRPGGGGGGMFGNNPPIITGGEPTGTVGEPGNDGSPNATDAITGLQQPQGGSLGPVPFNDNDDTNDFFGVAFDEELGELVFGELNSVQAGAGGGGGGDALPSNVFPTPDWQPGSDEKGAGGGGSGGGLLILALDDIVISGLGTVTSSGGRGGSGENVIFTDRIGGGSGGGSGGHIVLQGKRVDFRGSTADFAVEAIGGRAGFGQNGVDSTNAGGDGGPGLIQVHVQDPTTDLLFDVGADLAAVSRPTAQTLIPLFGPVSRSRSVWIPLGTAPNPEFSFDGIDPSADPLAQGLVQTTDGEVDELPALLGPATVTSGPTAPFIAPDGRTLVVDASSLEGGANDLYLRNTRLTRNFVVRLSEIGNPINFRDFDVVAASAYDPASGLLSLTTSSQGPTLDSFAPAGGVEYTLVPRFFEVVTDDIADALPDSATVRIRFQGAFADLNGKPDEDAIAVDWTSDVADLNGVELDFVRFEVEFDIDALLEGLTAESPRPAINFLRLPFLFGLADD